MTSILERLVTRATGFTDTYETNGLGPMRLLAGLDVHSVLDLEAHTATHGALPSVPYASLLHMLDEAGLSGRGGAGFPLADKIRALRGGTVEIVVNGSEGEPGSWKDRTLLSRSPHLVIDGALVVASATDARKVTIVVKSSEHERVIRRAIKERRDARIVNVRVLDGGFVSGEARAVVRALAGGPTVPPGRPHLMTNDGILLSNVETFAQTAVLVRLGAERYANVGTRREPGTTLLTVGGAVERPGVVEVPYGTPLSRVLEAAGARDTQYVITGGYHGTWIRPARGIEMSRTALAEAGGSLGAGIVIAVDSRTCALGELARAAQWLADQSAQQCGPCVFGLPALAADVAALCAGEVAAHARAHRHADAVEGRGACKHPDGSVRFIRSGLAVLRDEIELHAHGGCGRPVLGRLPIGE